MVGVVSFGYGCYVYWQSGLVAPDPFVVGGMCVVSAAGVQIVRELWGRFRR